MPGMDTGVNVHGHGLLSLPEQLLWVEAEIGTTGNLAKLEEKEGARRQGVVVGGDHVHGDGEDRQGIEDGEEDEGCAKKQEDLKVGSPPGIVT